MIVYLSSQVRVAFAGEVRQLQQALREAGRRDVVLALEGARHRHAERQQQVRRLEVATGEVRQQLHVAHLKAQKIINSGRRREWRRNTRNVEKDGQHANRTNLPTYLPPFLPIPPAGYGI